MFASLLKHFRSGTALRLTSRQTDTSSSRMPLHGLVLSLINSQRYPDHAAQMQDDSPLLEYQRRPRITFTTFELLFILVVAVNACKLVLEIWVLGSLGLELATIAPTRRDLAIGLAAVGLALVASVGVCVGLYVLARWLVAFLSRHTLRLELYER